MLLNNFFLLLTALLFSFINLQAYPELSNAVKEKKIYPMGEKVYSKKCNKIDPSIFESYESMQEKILSDKLCKPLNQKYLQAVSLYLWDKKRDSKSEKTFREIVVEKGEKCPVCGMFVYKYPKWATQIFYGEKHYSFDGAKDMFKYYFDNKEGITEMLILDWYTQKTIDASKAFYVIGSDTYGPMGHELIGFKDEADAKTFYMDHRGKKVIRFEDITKESVYKLDE